MRPASDLRGEDVVPVLAGEAQSLDGGMKRDHGIGHRLAGVIQVKVAVEGPPLREQVGEPGRAALISPCVARLGPGVHNCGHALRNLARYLASGKIEQRNETLRGDTTEALLSRPGPPHLRVAVCMEVLIISAVSSVPAESTALRRAPARPRAKTLRRLGDVDLYIAADGSDLSVDSQA